MADPAVADPAVADRAAREDSGELLARYMDEVWNKGNYDVAREVVADDMLVHGAGGQVLRQGPEGVIDLVSTWRGAFPDGRMTVHEILVDGDLVADRLTWEGTHAGEFYGIAPTHRTVRCTSIGSDRVVDGRFTEGWGEVDMLSMMVALDAATPVFPAATGAWSDGPGAARDPLARRRRSGVLPDTEGSRLAVRSWFDLLATGDDDGLRALVAPDFTDHDPATGGVDLESELRFLRRLRAAVPDLRIEPDTDHVIVDGDRVLARWRATGTHTDGPLLGVEPAGASLAWTGSDIFGVRAGRLCERWVCADLLALIRQLGSA